MRLHDSVVVSIPACHAGDRGSIPRRGAFLNPRLRREIEINSTKYAKMGSLPETSDKLRQDPTEKLALALKKNIIYEAFRRTQLVQE